MLKKLKYNTQKNYLNIINKYIKPEIGKYYLSSIGPSRLQDLMNKLPNGFDRPLAKHSVEIVLTVLKGAFKRAVYPWQAINSNPWYTLKCQPSKINPNKQGMT